MFIYKITLHVLFPMLYVRLAEPKDLLQKRYQQFQRRLARHYLNSDQSEEGTAIQGTSIIFEYSY
jgi:hypothetical protein